MPKVSLNTIGSRYGSIDALNANFDDIEAAIENTLSLDGTSPNAMTADLDLNSNDLLNVGTTNTQTLYINGVEVEPSTGVSAGSAFQTYSFTATAGQTTFSVAPATPLVSSLLVSVNGLELPPADVTVSTTNVVIPACTLGDEVVVRRFTKEPTVYPTAATQDFQQAGTGAQIRTVQSKLRDVVSLADFGAVGDGVADDSTALQNFLNACKDGRGYIPPGNYRFTTKLTLDPRYGYNIEGAAWQNTNNAGSGSRLLFAGTTNAIEIINSPFTQNYDKQIRFANLTLEGNASSLDGFYVVQALIFLENVWITNHGRHGAYLEKAYSSAFKQVFFTQNYRHGCYVYRAGNALHFDHCAFNGNSRIDGYSGCQVSAIATDENLGIVFTSCDFTGNGYPGGVTTAFGIAIQHTWGIALIGCYGELNKLRNVYADSSVKGLSITNSYWQDSMVELVNVVGLTYENNVHQYISIPTSATITGTTNARQMVRVHGNTFVGGATSSFSSGVKQRNESYANAAPTAGTFEVGDIVWYANPDQGTPFGWVCTAAGTPGTWRPIIDRLPGTYANWGDSDATLSALSSLGTNFWRSALTATRSVTLSTTGAYAGAKFRIVRAASATGAFNLNVGSGPLKALTAAGQWCDVEYDGSTWLLSAYGSL